MRSGWTRSKTFRFTLKNAVWRRMNPALHPEYTVHTVTQCHAVVALFFFLTGTGKFIKIDDGGRKGESDTQGKLFGSSKRNWGEDPPFNKIITLIIQLDHGCRLS